MTSNERTLRNLLVVQGFFYLATNLWALVSTASFLSYANPSGDLFEARSFAALSLVLAIFFLVGAWRKDLLRPASFLGLGSAAAIVLVELFHVPSLGWSLLWVDFFVELGIAGLFITLFFFRHETEEVAVAPADATTAPLGNNEQSDLEIASEDLSDATLPDTELPDGGTTPSEGDSSH
jgi:hypothetical protein